LKPDDQHTWLVPEHADEYNGFLPIAAMFELHSRGLQAARDGIAYDWSNDKLTLRMKMFIADYNAQVHWHKADRAADWPDHIDWSRDLKQDARRGNTADFDDTKLVRALYRPFAKRWLFFDRMMNEEVYQWHKISGRVIAVGGYGRKAFAISQTDCIYDLNFYGDPAFGFPLSHLKDSALAEFRRHYSDDSIAKDEVFHYLYALLHHPVYRERYAANLKRELPRIPLAPNFKAFAKAGRELSRLHVEYESLKPWSLEEILDEDVPYSEKVTKMKLSADKRSLKVNESLMLGGIPPETFEYRLGSRSAFEWVIDQYQVKGESDPNREDDPGYIIRLVGQVVRVSIETTQIVRTLPAYKETSPALHSSRSPIFPILPTTSCSTLPGRETTTP
jgi:predicted helicase